MKIRIIDLLNMISKGKEVPKKIKYDGIWYSRGWCDYMGDEPIAFYYYHNVFGSWLSNDNLTLDTEVEILEEDKKIEKLPNVIIADETTKELIKSLNELHKEYKNKINELIDAVNELKKGE